MAKTNFFSKVVWDKIEELENSEKNYFQIYLELKKFLDKNYKQLDCVSFFKLWGKLKELADALKSEINQGVQEQKDAVNF